MELNFFHVNLCVSPCSIMELLRLKEMNKHLLIDYILVATMKSKPAQDFQVYQHTYYHTCTGACHQLFNDKTRFFSMNFER